MCITSVTISCDDRRKPNIKHVFKSAPLPTSLQHSAKQYNLKIFHAFFHRYLFVICIIFLLFVFSQSIFCNYLLFIFITLTSILTLLYIYTTPHIPSTFSKAIQSENISCFFPSLFVCYLYHFLIVCFFSIYFLQLFSFHIYNTN